MNSKLIKVGIVLGIFLGGIHILGFCGSLVYLQYHNVKERGFWAIFDDEEIYLWSALWEFYLLPDALSGEGVFSPGEKPIEEKIPDSIRTASKYTAFPYHNVAHRLVTGKDVGEGTKSDEQPPLLPLAEAARDGDMKKVRELLNNGVDVNQKDHTGLTALIASATTRQTKISEILINNGADVNAADTNGTTPLFMAAMTGNLEIAKLLISNGANPNAKNIKGGTPVNASIANAEVMDMLLKKGGRCEDDSCRMLIKFCIELNRIDIITVLENNRINFNISEQDGWTLLHESVLKGRTEIAKLLLAGGAKPNPTSKEGTTPIHLAAEKGNIEAVKLLVKNGANIESKLEDGGTPLALAVVRGHTDIVEYLLRKNANTDIRSRTGDTLLHAASFYGYREIVEILIKNGTPINERNSRNETPLSIAKSKRYKDVVDLIKKRGGVE